MAKKKAKKTAAVSSGHSKIKTAQELIKLALRLDSRVIWDSTHQHELKFSSDDKHLDKMVSKAISESLGDEPFDLGEILIQLEGLDFSPVHFEGETNYAVDVLSARFELDDELPRLKVGQSIKDVELTLGLAIVLGMKLGRYFDHKEIEEGENQTRARRKGAQARKSASVTKSEFAKAEFKKRMAGESGDRKRTQTLKNMAKEFNPDGTRKYGGYSTLEGYYKSWKL